MIVTCASCLTKYQLDDSRISEKGAKVRCSRCKHVFYVVLPPETKEEVTENFESFAKYHEELMGPDQRGMGISTPEEEEERGKEAAPREGEEDEEKFLFSDQTPAEKVEPFSLPKLEEGEETEIRESKPKRAAIDQWKMRGERKRPSRLFGLVVVIAILIFGLFYLWGEMESGGKLSSYLENPIKKATQLWEKVWGAEKEGLVVKDLTGYEEKVGEFPLYIIEGKVENQSQKTKKLIKVKVVIFDQNRMKVTEKETLCGRTIDRGELKNLPSDFFSGEMIIQPKTEKEMIAPSGKAVPFVVIFKDLPAQAKEFKVEIIEAPSI
ncbi:MAG: zinc-ribbon domain-containing protein [Syntrophaceae bacterium]|nr:zinc-ribbon domain-containing protein [Syntrophaceae bacterium]